MSDSSSNPYNLNSIITKKLLSPPMVEGGADKKKSKNSYIEVPKKSWNHLQQKDYIKYQSDGVLKLGCNVSQVVADGIVVYAMIGGRWRTWKVSYDKIEKIYKYNGKKKVNIGSSGNSSKNLDSSRRKHIQQQETFDMGANNTMLFNTNIPIEQSLSVPQNTQQFMQQSATPVTSNNFSEGQSAYSRAEIEILIKKVENLEIFKEYVTAELKKISDILLRMNR
jgi:hypothetical protein